MTIKKKIIIIGKGKGWENAPIVEEGSEIWGVNNICLRRSVDLAFNMHNLEKHSDHPLFMKTVAHTIANKIPIVTQKEYDFIPNCIPFPLSYCERKYFTNSIDYMVAYVCYLSVHVSEYRWVSELHLYGVVMMTGTEYMVQRPSLEYWLGVADGLGLEVVVHEPTWVFKPPRKGLYGYDWDEEDAPHIKAREENQQDD